MKPGIIARITGVDGTCWTLTGTQGPAPVVLESLSGLVGAFERTLVGRSDGFGVDVGGVVLKQISGSMSLRFRYHHGRLAGDWYYQFLRSLSLTKPARLIVTDGTGREWGLPIVLQSPPAEPENSPYSYHGGFSHSVSLLGLDGCYTGKTITSGGRREVIRNRGDIPIFPRIIWSGTNKHITPPQGPQVRLPDVKGTHVLSTNPGEGFPVWDSEGELATRVRQQMRGKAVFGRIDPGEEAAFGPGPGVNIQWEERIVNPWV